MDEMKTKILLVDDNVVNIKVLAKYLAKENYEVIISDSGEDAIEKYKACLPDIVLMDIMMSGMNGLEATAIIKKLANDKWVPVIFMSALASDEDKIKGLDVGGDDYITKPIEFSILRAKLKAIQRISEIQNKLSETTQQLQQYKQAEEIEQQMAYELLESLFDTGELSGKYFHVWHVPTTRFSGDLIIAEKQTDDRLYILHADSTGHGLTAALPLLPVSQTFYHMARKGYSIGFIARRMNEQLKSIMPINRFVAMTLLLVDFKNNLVEVWNGGNPPVLVINKENKVIKSIKSTHLALGILPDDEFDMTTEFAINDCEKVVVLYSDGLVEAENAEGKIFDDSMLISCLEEDTSAIKIRDNIVDAVTKHLDGGKAHDDMSLVVLDTIKPETKINV